MIPYSCGMISGMKHESEPTTNSKKPHLEHIRPLQPTVDIIRTPEGANHSRIIYIFGVSGVGKDTVVKDFLRTLPKEKKGQFQTVNVSSLYQEAIKLPHDDLQHLSPADIMQYSPQVAAEILSLQPAVVIGHLVHKQGGDVIFDKRLQDLLNPNYYVFLSGDPKRILDNRKKDGDNGTRMREIEDMETIEAIQSLNYKCVQAEAKEKNAGLIRLNMSYHDENLHQENARYLWKIVQTILPTSSSGAQSQK